MPRLRRIARRLGLALLELLVVLTVASGAYNLATAGRIKPATELYAGPFLRVSGELVAYRRWGTRGTPIILLGGFIVPSSVWEGVGRRLGHDHRVFALDLPPFGYTERKGPYTLRGWVDLVHAFEKQIGLHRPVLVGHSLGAAVAVEDARWYPDDPKGIVLLDGDAISARGAPSWVSKLLVGPWFTSLYRIGTGSDWIFRRGLAGAYPNHPAFTRRFLDQWERRSRYVGRSTRSARCCSTASRAFVSPNCAPCACPRWCSGERTIRSTKSPPGAGPLTPCMRPSNSSPARAISRCSARQVRSRARSIHFARR